MDTNFDRDRIDRLQRKLYSRKTSDAPQDERTPITQTEFTVDEKWGKGSSELQNLVMAERNHKEAAQGAIFKKILVGSIVFFLLAAGITGYLFFGGLNSISGNNIDIQVVGPSTIGGGEKLSLDIVVKNNNNADLENGSLTIEYPEGARSASDINTPLVREEQEVGTLSARSESRKTVQGILFGEKGTQQTIVVTFEYQLKGASAVFRKEKRYDIAIKSSPVIVTIENPNEVNSNQEVSFSVTIASNSSEVLKNVLLKAEYPFGFSYSNSDTKPVDASGTLWRIGDLGVSAQKKITIQGILQGQNEEERTFRFSTGIENPDKQSELGAVFSVIPQTIKIKKPFLGVDVRSDGNSNVDIVARPGERVQTNISWMNNLPNRLLNTKVLVQFSGDGLDKASVTSDGGGFYRSIDNTIVFDKNNTQGFTSFEPGDKGSVSFEFAPLPNAQSGAGRDIKISITVSGDQVFDNGKSEFISTTVQRNVKLATQVNIRALVVRSIGAFENSGSVPPKVDTPTTYTVQWFATNSRNTVQRAKMTATLPQYVEWTGLTSPGTELVSYDENSRVVSWSIGDLKAGAGYGSAPRVAQFQVSFTPSISQLGSIPVLLSASTFTGLDTSTSRSVGLSAGELTTKYSTDLGYRLNDEIVTK